MMEDGPMFGKYWVSRVDGRDRPGGDKDNARYFVLDYVNDKFAREAMLYYACHCYKEMPVFAASILQQLGVDPSVIADRRMMIEMNAVNQP